MNQSRLKKTLIKNVFFLLIAVVLSSGVEWAPRYVALLSQDTTFFSGKLQDYKVPCDGSVNGKMICVDKYVIPRRVWNFPSSNEPAIGLGIAFPATTIKCVNESAIASSFGTTGSQSQAVALFHTYETLDLVASKCDGDLEMWVWAPGLTSRSGYVGAPLVISSATTVSLVKKAVEFFTTQTYLIFALGMIACLLVTSLFLRPFVGAETMQSEFDVFSRAWTVFAFCCSGAEMLFPSFYAFLPFVRIQFYFSIIAHAGPVLLAASASHHTPWICRRLLDRFLKPVLNVKYLGDIRGLHFAVAGLMLTPIFLKSLVVVGITIVPLYLWLAMTRKDSRLFLFGLCALVECLKLMNVRYMPYGNLPLSFTFLVTIDHFITRVSHGARVVTIMLWSKSISGASSLDDVNSAIRSFAELFGIKRVTYIEPNENGQCTITQNFLGSNGRWVTEPIFREEIPPAFAYVLTTGSSIVNLSEDSEFAMRLHASHKGYANRNNPSSHFSVYCFSKDSLRTGAIAFSDYPASIFENNYLQMEFDAGLQFLLPFLGSQLWTQRLSITDDWYRSSIKIGESIQTLSVPSAATDTLGKLLQLFADEIAGTLDSSVIIGRVHPHSRSVDVKVLAGFSEAITRQYQEIQFYAISENVKGPMALAVNEKIVITISDINWVLPHLTKPARELMIESRTKSAAVIPLFVVDESETAMSEHSMAWGFIWIESKKVGAFNEHHTPGLKVIGASVGGALARQQITSRAHEALTGIPRMDIRKKLLNGQSVTENEVGFLVIADIRGSSRIANQYGAKVWSNFVEALEQSLITLAAEFSYTYQFVAWDAFHFTKPETNPASSAIDQIIEFANRMNALLEATMSVQFPDASVPSSGARARFCVEYGDNSRGLQFGVWTISGSSMPNCCKLEATCKGLPGWIFLTDSFSFSRPNDFEVRPVRKNPATNRCILSYSRRPSVLDVSRTEVQNIFDTLNAQEKIAQTYASDPLSTKSGNAA